MHFSIITCAYNPDVVIFKRVAKAVLSLQVPAKCQAEWLIIDNNSNPAIAEYDWLQAMIEENSTKSLSVRIIKEEKQGLTAARLRGYYAAKGDFLILIDDDNEPSADYLEVLQDLLPRYEFVGAWGPGTIEVDFLAPVSKKYEGHYRGTFQEKHLSFTNYAHTESSSSAHPFGTGMVIRKTLMQEYVGQCEKGHYQTTDRIGNSLASAGDTQMVYSVVKQGFAVGCEPKLALKHIIPAKRLSYDYMRKMSFEINFSAVLADYEMNNAAFTTMQLPKAHYVIRKALSMYIGYLWRRVPLLGMIYTMGYLGKTIGYYTVKSVKIPYSLRWFLRLLGYRS
ncbi:MAG: glycosyltransferase family 2 protein [Cytophagales bacterium]|nr:MAG: glycosyltransferase family 2 protein [Cytophagales bacterium]